MKTENECETTTKVAGASVTADAIEAAAEFASTIKAAIAGRGTARRFDRYEVRPCSGVRGFTLMLPLIGWRLWFPDPQSAQKFAERVAAIYRAECSIYNSARRLAHAER